MTLVGQIGITKVKQSGYTSNLLETPSTIWTGTPAVYSYPPAATKLFLCSTNTEDGDGNFTGARTVEVLGLNSAWALQSEFKDLNGLNPVQTNEYFNRVYLLHAHSAGILGKNVGEISCGAGSVSDGVPNSMYMHIQSGDSKSLASMITIPGSSIGEVNAVQYTIGQDKDVECSLVFRQFGSIFQLEDRVKVYRNTVTRVWLANPIVLPAKTDIEIRGKKDTAGGTIAMTAALNITVRPMI